MLPDNPEGLLKNLKKPRPDGDPAEPPTEASPPVPPRRSEAPPSDERHAVRQIPGVTTR
jgi:membrane protein required for colicin V production